MGSCLCFIESVQPRRDASTSYECGPIQHGEARRARARLGVMQRASSEQVVARDVDRGHWRVVLRGEPVDVCGIFDGAVDGEANGAVEFVVQQLVCI